MRSSAMAGTALLLVQLPSNDISLQGLAAMKAVGIARLQQCSLVVVPEADPNLAAGQPVAMTVFVLVDF